MSLAGLLVGHDALGSGDDGDAQTMEHAGQLLGTGVDAQAGLGHTAKTGQGLLLAGLEILEIGRASCRERV